ncbi:MAG: mechanosensitive ion channel protein MscS [Burkholderiales bacterium PBB3]|nr:MAG: mechanosensitive ion channel protein MscS [Burkholderiales bacterium PBB3]
MTESLLELLKQQLLLLNLVMALAALALRFLRPHLRHDLKLTWWLLVLGPVSLAAAVLANGQGHTVAAGILNGAATVSSGLTLIQFLVLLVFLVVLPALGTATPRIARDLTVTGLSLAWGMVWLRLMGVDPSQLFTTSAIITAVIAFAMQDTLGNVLGGVMLQLDNSLRVGEWVRVDNISGRVVDVRWRFTAIETRDRETFVVPNSWLMKNRFGVLRQIKGEPLLWRRNLFFNVDASASPSVVIAALQKAVADASIEHVAQQPAPSAVLMDTSTGYFRYCLRYWLTDAQFDDPTDSAVRVHALAALARTGASLGLVREERLMIKENDNWRQANTDREMERRLNAVQRTTLFVGLPQAEQMVLAQYLKHAPFAAGGTLTRQGAVAHWLYLIVQGQVQVQVEQGGVKTLVSTLKDGDFFGEMGMLTGEPRSATVVALTDVDCYRLDNVGFAQVLVARPEIANEISAILSARRHDLNARLKAAKLQQHATPVEDLRAKIKAFFGVTGS